MNDNDPTRRLSSQAIAAGDPTGWFEWLHAEVERDEAVVPWDRDAPHSLLSGWSGRSGVDGPAEAPWWSAAGSTGAVSSGPAARRG